MNLFAVKPAFKSPGSPLPLSRCPGEAYWWEHCAGELKYIMMVSSKHQSNVTLLSRRPNEPKSKLDHPFWFGHTKAQLKNIAKIANAVPVTLYSRVTVNVAIVVFNCQKCNQCLKGHKSLALFSEDVFQLSLSLSFSLHLSLSFCWSGYVSSSF